VDELRIIDPLTKEPTTLSTISGFSDEIKILFSLSISLYNKALRSYSTGDLDSAWQYISESLSTFPYVNISLSFGWTLALELGKYEQASAYLGFIKIFLSEKEHNRLRKVLDEEMELYNSLLIGNVNNVRITSKTRMIHTVLMGLINPQVKETDIYNAVLQLRTASSPIHREKTIKGGVRIYFYIIIPILLITAFIIYDIDHNKNIALNRLNSIEIELRELENELVETSRQMKDEHTLNILLSAIYRKNYHLSGELLVQYEEFIDSLNSMNDELLDIICKSLYQEKQYSILSEINYSSYYHIHADFNLILASVGIERRAKKAAFVEKYLSSTIYTAPLLRELYDTEDNASKRAMFAQRLKKLIIEYPNLDLEIYLSKHMQDEME